MKIHETIGIDVSKLFIDVYLHSVKLHKQFKNNSEGFILMFEWVNKKTNFELENRLYAMEHTGMYSLPVSVFLTEKGCSFILISGLELKKSLGISRGKTDKIDARMIALYAYRRREEVSPSKLPSKIILELRRLLSLRDKLVQQRSGFKSTVHEMKAMRLTDADSIYLDVQEKMIINLSEEIKRVEKALQELICSEEELAKQFNLITSIIGVGKLTAFFMIAFTNGFTLFENSRKFASYAGIAPFPYQSGTSVKGLTKISFLGNMKFKSLLSNCASSAICNNTEIRLYYDRRIKDGKNKMSTINAIRNKILGRIFAVVQRGTPYVDTLAFCS